MPPTSTASIDFVELYGSPALDVRMQNESYEAITYCLNESGGFTTLAPAEDNAYTAVITRIDFENPTDHEVIIEIVAILP